MQQAGKEYTEKIFFEKVLNFAGFHYKLSLKSTKQCVYLVDYNLQCTKQTVGNKMMCHS